MKKQNKNKNNNNQPVEEEQQADIKCHTIFPCLIPSEL